MYNSEHLLLVQLLHRIIINSCEVLHTGAALNIYYCSLVGFLQHLRVRGKMSVCFEPAISVFSLLFIELQGGLLWVLLCGLEVTCFRAVSIAPSHA